MAFVFPVVVYDTPVVGQGLKKKIFMHSGVD